MSRRELLTAQELATLDRITDVSRAIKQLGWPRNDWVEARTFIHGLQQMIMSNAAARAYPDRFRLLADAESDDG